ncbi:TPA: lipopolysaccharide heptosyltransferase II [bacterium]|nr:MAG: lipopolysaccharide heptosyltransferase II [Candidatus Hydrogenedentes bacterium CG1_02_42_14]HBW46702.1 lipopolysaccharide heptosyltransferase II [bacterium]
MEIFSTGNEMKILVRAPNWLGDAVMARPALNAIIKEVGNKNVSVVAKSSVASAFADCEVFVMKNSWDIASHRKKSFDSIILFTNSFSSAFLAWQSGIKNRIGYDNFAVHFLLTKRIARSKTFLHQIDEYLHLTESAGYRSKSIIPTLPFRKNNHIEEKYVVLAPGAKYGAAKRWNKFDKLAVELASKGKKVVVLGSAGEAENIFERENILNLAGETTLDIALDIVAHAQIVISNDSGLAHASSALGRRTIVIFGPTDPKRTLPRNAELIQEKVECAPCGLRICPIDHRCMNSITVEEVLARIG